MTLLKKKKPAAASSVVSGEALGMDANIAKKEGFSLPVNTFLYEKLKELEGASD